MAVVQTLSCHLALEATVAQPLLGAGTERTPQGRLIVGLIVMREECSDWAVGGYLLCAGNGVQDPIHTQVYKAHMT